MGLPGAVIEPEASTEVEIDACNDATAYRETRTGPSGDAVWSRLLAETHRRAVRLGRAASFWAAVVLPFAALVHLRTGVASAEEWGLLVGLLFLDAVALYLGHPYCRSD